MSPENEVPVNGHAFCMECGRALEAGWKFCMSCGTPVLMDGGESALPPPGPGPFPSHGQIHFSDSVTQTPQSPLAVPPTSKFKLSTWSKVSIVFAITLLLGGGLFFAWFSKNSDALQAAAVEKQQIEEEARIEEQQKLEEAEKIRKAEEVKAEEAAAIAQVELERKQAQEKLFAEARASLREAMEWREGMRGNVDHVKAKTMIDELAQTGEPLSVAFQSVYRDSWILPPNSRKNKTPNAVLDLKVLDEVKQLAEEDNAEANFIMGKLSYSDNKGKALTYWKRSAKAEYLPAVVALSSELVSQPDSATVQEGLTGLDSAARKGNAEAALVLGRLFDEGRVVTTNTTTAAQYFKFGADKKSPWCLSHLGEYLYKGVGVEKDMVLGQSYLQQAADLGLPIAQALLGQIFHIKAQSPDREATDLPKAAYYLELSVSSGEMLGAALLSTIYHNGIDVAKDCNKAAYYAKLAADSGDELGKVMLACCSIEGCGVPLNVAGPLKELDQYAKAGNIVAMQVLYKFYKPGVSRTPDPKLSRYWLEKAAEAGEEWAKEDLRKSFD